MVELAATVVPLGLTPLLNTTLASALVPLPFSNGAFPLFHVKLPSPVTVVLFAAALSLLKFALTLVPNPAG